MSSLKDLASLIMIPSLYKDGELHTVKPLADENIIVHPDATNNNDGVDGTTPSTSSNFTFSRGSNLAATRVDVNGLIEKGRENVLLYSNDFTLGNWSNDAGACTRTGGQAGYDGSNDAWLITQDTAGYDNIRSLSTGLTSGISTMSVYAKAGTGSNMHIRIPSDASRVQFNLSTGVASNKGGAISQGMEDVGGGWYRCYATFNSNVDLVQIYPDFGSASPISIYIQDAQLEQGLIATDYIETTTTSVSAGILEDMPRLDYSGSCPSLLLEPQRTNQNNQSEYFGGWTANATITANAGISPEGVQNAYNIASNSGVGNGILKIIGVLSSTQYVCSIYVKSAGATTGKLRLFDGSTGASTTTTFTPTSEWQRVEVTRTSGSSTFQFRVDIHSNDADLLIYGCQLEAGSYPTSYIPTYGTSQTRSGDAPADRNDLQDYIGTNEGTWFMDFDELFFDITGTGVGSIQINYAGVSSQSIEFVTRSTNQYKITLNNSTAVDYQGGADKVAIAWHSEGIKIFINGTQQYASTSSQYSNAFTRLVMSYSSRRPHIKMKQLAFFPTALTDSECIALTTL